MKAALVLTLSARRRVVLGGKTIVVVRRCRIVWQTYHGLFDHGMTIEVLVCDSPRERRPAGGEAGPQLPEFEITPGVM